MPILLDGNTVYDNFIILNGGCLIIQCRIATFQTVNDEIIQARVKGDPTPLTNALNERGLCVRLEETTVELKSEKKEQNELFSLILRIAYELKVQLTFLGHKTNSYIEVLFLKIITVNDRAIRTIADIRPHKYLGLYKTEELDGESPLIHAPSFFAKWGSLQSSLRLRDQNDRLPHSPLKPIFIVSKLAYAKLDHN